VANVVAARWRAEDGGEDRLAPVIAELIRLSCWEPGCPFHQANCSIEDPRLSVIYERYVDEAGYRAHGESEHFAPPAHNYAIPQLLEDRQLEFFTTFYDDRVGLAG
jgi:quinol monooxygenase YgiN